MPWCEPSGVPEWPTGLTTAIIAVLAVYLKESWLLDVCIIYCLISFLAVVVLAKINIVSHEKGEEFDDV